MIKAILGPTEYVLALPHETAIALESHLNTPFGVLYKRVIAGECSLNELHMIVLHGLIGGGIDDRKAFSIVENYVKPRPVLQNLTLAFDLMELAWSGELPLQEAA